jgi:L-alanine-DL-glutamate epimerase-like enolase superfamily enzyme
MLGGYTQGFRKKIVLKAYREGKTIQQLIREGHPYKATLSAASRCGIRLKTESGRVGWGEAKQVVIDAEREGWTYEEARKRSGMKISNLKRCAEKLKIKLYHYGQKQEVQIA